MKKSLIVMISKNLVYLASICEGWVIYSNNYAHLDATMLQNVSRRSMSSTQNKSKRCRRKIQSLLISIASIRNRVYILHSSSFISNSLHSWIVSTLKLKSWRKKNWFQGFLSHRVIWTFWATWQTQRSRDVIYQQ